MLVVYERWAGDSRTDCYIDPKFFFDHSSTSFSSWLGCSIVGHWGPKSLYLLLGLTSLASCLRLTQAVCALVISLFNVHLLPLFFRLFTQVHLLIDGSVEGQYITLDTTEWARWSPANCAISLNLTILPNGICTTQNPSWKMKCTNFSGILKYKCIT